MFNSKSFKTPKVDPRVSECELRSDTETPSNSPSHKLKSKKSSKKDLTDEIKKVLVDSSHDTKGPSKEDADDECESESSSSDDDSEVDRSDKNSRKLPLGAYDMNKEVIVKKRLDKKISKMEQLSKPKKTKLGELSEDEKAERHKEQMKMWRSKNPEYNKTYRQKYYAENREAILEKRRAKRAEEKKILEEFKAYKASLEQ